MSTIEKLKVVTLEHRKNKTGLGPSLQFHTSEIVNVGKNQGNRETTEDEAIQYVKKAVQKLKENPHHNPLEVSVLEGLLPKMASEQEILDFLRELFTGKRDGEIPNKGVVMKEAKQKFGLSVDMKRLSQLANETYGV
jgi:uncharacterized protein YqeY